MQRIHNALRDRGLHPTYQPLGLKLNEANSLLSACVRCYTCDSFPCLLDAKADADIDGVRPAMTYANLTLITEAKVLRLHTSPSGREVTGVEAEVAGETRMFSGDIVVISGGAVNSAVLLLRSANDKHPNGLANSSDLVGRNYMAHKFASIAALSLKPHETIYPKTLAVNDFYWGEKDFPYPMGNAQTLGTITADRAAKGYPWAPRVFYEAIADRAIAWLLITEDLPDPNNRVRVRNEKIFLDYTNNNEEAFKRLIRRWHQVLKSIDPFSLYLTSIMPLKNVGHCCGTCRFGEDPETSVLDLNCRSHDVDNLYVVDGSFFPSSSAVNPSLTIIANAIRVGEHLLERLQCGLPSQRELATGSSSNTKQINR
jgi:choline dehydrogenase-like flavoprotein